MTVTASIRLPATTVRRRRAAFQRLIKGIIGVIVAVIAACLLWEGYKALGQLTGDFVPSTGIPLPVSTSDKAMPHLSTIFDALFSPASAASSQTLAVYYLEQTSVTLREALYGMLVGAAIGVVLAVILREISFLGRGVLPWLVISQTIPLVALAPIIVVWVGGAGLPSWVAVSIIAAYLSFFPVTVNMLTGLNSADAIHLEFMRSIAAPNWMTMFFIRLPGALPNLFTGLRLAATASVIGAIVGELSAGTGLGIGRAILTAAFYFSNAPENLFAAVAVAAIGGVLFVQLITLAEAFVLRKRSQ